MIKPLLCFTLVAATGVAIAAGPGDDRDASREARRAEWQAQADARFAAADADRDGSLDRVEAATLHARIAGHFERLDADGNGELTREELRQARRHHRGGRGLSYMAGLFHGMDDDGNDALSRAELGTKAPRLAEAFAAIDADGNGELSRDELRAHHAQMRRDHGGHGDHGDDHGAAAAEHAPGH